MVWSDERDEVVSDCEGTNRGSNEGKWQESQVEQEFGGQV